MNAYKVWYLLSTRNIVHKRYDLTLKTNWKNCIWNLECILYIYLYIIHLKIRRLIFFANTLTLPVYFEIFIRNIRLLSITIFLSKISRIFLRLNLNFFILTVYKNVKSWISSVLLRWIWWKDRSYFDTSSLIK